jgi:hypothetical protein
MIHHGTYNIIAGVRDREIFHLFLQLSLRPAWRDVVDFRVQEDSSVRIKLQNKKKIRN